MLTVGSTFPANATGPSTNVGSRDACGPSFLLLIVLRSPLVGEPRCKMLPARATSDV